MSCILSHTFTNIVCDRLQDTSFLPQETAPVIPQSAYLHLGASSATNPSVLKTHQKNTLFILYSFWARSMSGVPFLVSLNVELNAEMIFWETPAAASWAELRWAELAKGETQPATFGWSWAEQSSAELSRSGQGWVEANERWVVCV